MKEIINSILEKIDYPKKEKLSKVLVNSIEYFQITEKETTRTHRSILFRTDVFFKEFGVLAGAYDKGRKYEVVANALYVICDELDIRIDEKDCFILFHLRDLGKFKIREEKLLGELKKLWQQYSSFSLTDKEFSASLRDLRHSKMINYRKGSLSLCPNTVISYRN